MPLLQCRGRVTCKYTAVCSRSASSERSHVEAISSPSYTAKARRVACSLQPRSGLPCVPLLVSRSWQPAWGVQCSIYATFMRQSLGPQLWPVNNDLVINSTCSLQAALASCMTVEPAAAEKHGSIPGRRTKRARSTATCHQHIPTANKRPHRVAWQVVALVLDAARIAGGLQAERPVPPLGRRCRPEAEE